MFSALLLLVAAVASPPPGFDSTGHCADCGLGCHHTSLWPLGFSERGVFAYLLREDSDPLPRWRLVYQSLVTDEPVAQAAIEDPEGDLGRDAALAALDEAIQGAPTVERPSTLPTGPFPLEHGGDVYSALSSELGMQLRSQLRDRDKRIGGHEVAAVLGWVRSPHEERIAVVAARAQPGFEGTVQCEIEVVGASLTAGWGAAP